MTIVERIQSKAKEKGITIKELEREAGLSNGIIRRWNDSSPQCNKLLIVANYLQVSLDWLVLGEENTIELSLSKTEQKIINAYRAVSPDKQEAIRAILKVPDSEPESEIETSSECKVG